MAGSTAVDIAAFAKAAASATGGLAPVLNVSVTIDKEDAAQLQRLLEGKWIRKSYPDLLTHTGDTMHVAMRNTAMTFSDTGEGARSIRRMPISLDRTEISVYKYMADLDEGVKPGMNETRVFNEIMGNREKDGSIPYSFARMNAHFYSNNKYKSEYFASGWLHRKKQPDRMQAVIEGRRVAKKISKKGITSRIGWINRARKNAMGSERWRTAIRRSLRGAYLIHVMGKGAGGR